MSEERKCAECMNQFIESAAGVARAFCRRPYEVVDGKVGRIFHPTLAERSGRSVEHGGCGPTGKFWEAK